MQINLNPYTPSYTKTHCGWIKDLCPEAKIKWTKKKNTSDSDHWAGEGQGSWTFYQQSQEWWKPHRPLRDPAHLLLPSDCNWWRTCDHTTGENSQHKAENVSTRVPANSSQSVELRPRLLTSRHLVWRKNNSHTQSSRWLGFCSLQPWMRSVQNKCCVCVHTRACACSHLMFSSLLTLWTIAYRATLSANLPGKNTGWLSPQDLLHPGI